MTESRKFFVLNGQDQSGRQPQYRTGSLGRLHATITAQYVIRVRMLIGVSVPRHKGKFTQVLGDRPTKSSIV
ncbi:hypothetical protein RRG08_042262 [Elysia crispata]|uniref:Uncharacterized protein n=1 Tax=Elysia crispata TaxID=231223 RepID=A0AAE1E4K6_9GAST|nr:hypothetical protein RRG08_042262 [Elysia crispata]